MGENTNNGKKKINKKRTFSEMNKNENENEKVMDIMDDDVQNVENAVFDDFDIFEDVGRDYVCDPDLDVIHSKDAKRRKVTFMKPSMERSYFEHSKNTKDKDSETKHAAASILKSSLNKAKLDNL